MTRPARRLLRGPAGRRALVVALAVTALVAGAVVVPWPSTLVPGARAAGPATTVVVTLDPEAIPADGQSDTTATATVTDAEGNPVVDEEVKFTVTTAGPAEADRPGTTVPYVFQTTNKGDGTYTASIGYAWAPGPVTVTATTRSGASGSATLTITARGPYTMFVSLWNGTMPADGQTRMPLTAYVRAAYFAGTPEVTVSFRSDGDVKFSAEPGGTPEDEASCTTPIGEPAPVDPDTFRPPSVDPGQPFNPDLGSARDQLALLNTINGSCAVELVASTTVGFETIRATITATGTVEPVADAAGTVIAPPTRGVLIRETSTVELSLDPPTVPADGVSQVTATAVVTSGGEPLADEVVTFSTNGDVEIGPVTNHGNGTYTAVITASKTIYPWSNPPGVEEITATATRSSGSKMVKLIEVRGATEKVEVELDATQIQADGFSTSVATAKVTDAAGNPSTEETIAFATDGDVTFGEITKDEDAGTYATTITASETSGLETITVSVDGHGITGSVVLREWSRPAQTVTVELSPGSLPANGKAVTTATAQVLDVNGNPVLNELVVFSTSGDSPIGPVTNNGDGTFTTTITASKTPGQQTITALARSAGKSGTATLTQK